MMRSLVSLIASFIINTLLLAWDGYLYMTHPNLFHAILIGVVFWCYYLNYKSFRLFRKALTQKAYLKDLKRDHEADLSRLR